MAGEVPGIATEAVLVKSEEMPEGSQTVKVVLESVFFVIKIESERNTADQSSFSFLSVTSHKSHV